MATVQAPLAWPRWTIAAGFACVSWPAELPIFAASAVRTLQLGGLGVDEAQVLLAAKQLDGTGRHWAELNARCGGNGLALKVVGESIRELFDGEIGSFLEEAGAGSVFGGYSAALG